MKIGFVLAGLVLAMPLPGGAGQEAPPAATAAPAAEPAAATAPASGPLQTQEQRASYAIGLSMGKNLHQQELKVDWETFERGLRDGLSGAEGLLTEDQLMETMRSLQQEMVAKQMAKRQAQTEENRQAGVAFRDANKAKPGVTTLPSGLQYEVLQAGTGPKPKATDRVKVHYRGTLPDGTSFDSSYDRGEPAVFPVNAVIPGWTEALQLMPVGSKWKVVLPPELAYGERGAGPTIGPDATLVFEVELLGIEPPQAASPHGAPAAPESEEAPESPETPETEAPSPD